MVRASTAINPDLEAEGDIPDQEFISKPQEGSVESKDKEKEDNDLEEEMASKWVAFSNPTPFIVKARFNITEIELPSSTEAGEETEQNVENNTFLRMLIEEGIPVKTMSEEQSSEEPSNVGVILSPSDPIAEETLQLVPQSLEIQNNIREPTNKVDNVVEVIGCSKPISTPLFLHLVPSMASLQEGVIAPGTPEISKPRRGSVDPSIIMLPAEMKSLPVKKKVRFDLPGRKASLIGEYEILNKPVPSYGKRMRERSRSNSKNRCSHTSGEESSENDDEEKPIRRSRRRRKSKRSSRSSKDDAESSGSELDKCEVNPNDTEHQEEEQRPGHCNNPDQEGPGESSESGEYEVDIHCGLRSWTPKWLQIFARNECYLIVFCLVTLAQGIFCSYNKIILSTFQKRFHMTNTQAGFILSGNNIAQMIISIFVAFYGTYGNRPKWLGMAAMCSAFAAILAASPHLFYGPGELAEAVVENPEEAQVPAWWKRKITRKIELCHQPLEENCSKNSTATAADTFVIPPALLFSSQLIMGFANSVFWTVGVCYLDDNVNKKKTSLHIALFTIARVIGPPVGISLGAYCLSFWIDPSKSVKITHRDSKWIGAWWIGFFMVSFIIALPGFLYFCFPKQLRRKNRRDCHIQSSPNFIKESKKALYQRKTTNFEELSPKRFLFGIPCFGELPRGIKRLFTNKIWAANLFSNVFFALAMSNYVTFKNKYIQFQFRKPASYVGFYSGMTSMIATVVGIAVSGAVMRWYRPKTRQVTAYNVFLSIYGIISLFVLMTIHCPSSEVAGHLPGQEKWECSKYCSCSETFAPVCANDGVTTFYSACFAGCNEANLRVSPVEYVNCTCFGRQRWKDYLDDDEERSSYPINEGWAIEGFCPSKCNALTTYLAIQLLNKAIFATGRIGGTLINLRSVAERDKTLALGCLTMFVAFAGFIPTSVVLGSAIDSACLAWNTKCDQRGSCSFYDIDKFRLVLHAIPAALLVLSCIGDLIVHMNNSSLNIYGEPPEKIRNNIEQGYKKRSLTARREAERT